MFEGDVQGKWMSTGPDYPLYHGRGPRRQGAPADQLPNFYNAVLTIERSVYV